VPFPLGSENVVKSEGTGSSWASSFWRSSYNLSSGQAVRFEFQVTGSDSRAHFMLETAGSGGDPDYNRWCLIASNGKLRVQYRIGTEPWQYPKTLIEPLELNTWYVASLIVLPQLSSGAPALTATTKRKAPT
jgi:hypothetical protein